MTNPRPQRPSADSTRKKILHTAMQLFMQHGFAGTSMGEVAKKANINQALIFHHFVNKKQLWQQVKATITKDAQTRPINSEPESVAQFISEAIAQRVELYTECPSLKKLISWQKLESGLKQNLAGVPNSPISPLKWLEPTEFLQKKKLLNPKLKPELVVIWLVSSIDGLLNDDLGIFKNSPEIKKQYINMLIDTLSKGLAG